MPYVFDDETTMRWTPDETTPTVHNFDEKLKEGWVHEQALDTFFSESYKIYPATVAEQREGIDRIFVDPNGAAFTVEYKADSVAAQTGNAFIETVSVDADDAENRPGWALTSRADWLFYYIPPFGAVCGVRMEHIRANVSKWEQHYPTRQAYNEGYKSHGVCVPLPVISELAEWEVMVPFARPEGE